MKQSVYFHNKLLVKYVTKIKKEFINYKGLFILNIGDLLQHVSVQSDHLHKNTMKRSWVMGGLYINEISFVPLIGLC
jgi:hypothetical protein